jgi:hypothetical protein
MKYFESLKGWLLTFLKGSDHIHLKQKSLATLDELVCLIDRFLFAELNYPLEWDDFISWKQDNIHIEKVRENIGKYESLLFSKDKIDRDKYCEIVLEERNRVAKIAGLPFKH